MNSHNALIDDHRARKHFEGDSQYWKVSSKKINYVFHKTNKYFRKMRSCCDIGIGNGYTVSYFHNRGIRTTGVDISPYIIDHFKQKFEDSNTDIKLLNLDITKSKFGEAKYNLVTCFDVLEHLPDEGITPALNNIATSLKPDGILIGTLPLYENIEETEVVCPDCGKKFHPNGHYQSFHGFGDIKKMLSPKFDLVKFGEVPVIFTRIFLFYRTGNFFFKLARRIILNKRLSSAYFVARLK